jgi:thiol-disulfide isomerase/thioredoxin
MPHRRFRLACAVTLALSLFMTGSAAALPRKGEPAPLIQVTSTSGQRITNANYGGHVLLVHFFATWCAPCRESIPALIRLNKKFGTQGFQVLGLSIDEGGDRVVQAFIRDRKINYPVALAGDDLQDAYGVRSVPTFFLINRKGQVVEKFMGVSPETEREMESAIRKVLAEK